MKLHINILEPRLENGGAALQQMEKTSHNESQSNTHHENEDSAEQSDRPVEDDFKTALLGS